VAHGCWSTPAGQDTVLRLKTIHDAVAALIAEHAPDAVALEESFVGADARIALSVGQARGVVLVAAANAGVDCREYAPASVKQAICGYGRAEKAQMQRMVKMILGMPELPTPHHAADALAVAICHAHTSAFASSPASAVAPLRRGRLPRGATTWRTYKPA